MDTLVSSKTTSLIHTPHCATLQDVMRILICFNGDLEGDYYQSVSFTDWRSFMYLRRSTTRKTETSDFVR